MPGPSRHATFRTPILFVLRIARQSESSASLRTKKYSYVWEWRWWEFFVHQQSLESPLAREYWSMEHLVWVSKIGVSTPPLGRLEVHNCKVQVRVLYLVPVDSKLRVLPPYPFLYHMQEGPAQHVPAVTTETVEWCAPAVLRLAWYETFSHRVDPSEPARFFIVSSFSMLRANSVSKFLLWAIFGANSCSEQIWFLWAVFLYCEQIFFASSNLCVDRNCVMRTYLDCM